VIEGLNGKIFQLQGEVESLESDCKTKSMECKGLNDILLVLEPKCQDLSGALSQMSIDLSAANQKSQDLESKIGGLEKAKAKLEADVFEGGKQLQAKERESMESKQQLKAALDEIEGLRKQLKDGLSQDAALESERSELRRQLVVLSADRDNLVTEVAQFAAARVEFESARTAIQVELRGTQEGNSQLQNEIHRLRKNLGDAETEIENLRLELYNVQEKSCQKQEKQQSAASITLLATPSTFSKTNLERCCKLVGLVQQRVAEPHLASHDTVTTVSTEATTVR